MSKIKKSVKIRDKKVKKKVHAEKSSTLARKHVPESGITRDKKVKKKLLSQESGTPGSKHVPEPEVKSETSSDVHELTQHEATELSDLDPVDDEVYEDEINSHKRSLAKLAETDPEFYQFLEDNDKKLLLFDVSDSEDGEEEEAIHKPTETLEAASDESDFEVHIHFLLAQA